MAADLVSRLLRNLTALAVIAARILSPATVDAPATANTQSSHLDKSAPHSLELNGTTAYAEVPNAADLNPASDWTVEVWFRAMHRRPGLTIRRRCWSSKATLATTLRRLIFSASA